MVKNVLNWFVYVVMAALFLIMAGCGNDPKVTLTTATETGMVTGRVIDSSTKQPLKNVDVSLTANGAKMTTKTSDSNDPDLAGTFVFKGVSATPFAGHVLKVSAPGYATMQTNVAVSGSADNTPVSTSLGNMELAKSFDLTVVATDNGTPVSGVTISVASAGVPITAVADANGKALLQGLSQEEQYTIASAPFYDSNGNLKYTASTATYRLSSDRTLSLPLNSVSRYDDITIVGSNLLSDGSKNFSTYPSKYNRRAITPESVMKLVFNYPVTLAEPVTASYVNDQVASTAPDYGKLIPVPTVSATLDETGTILTISNSAAYTKNQDYIFNGTVTALVNGQKQTYSLGQVPASNPFFSSKVYVADNTATGLSSTSTLKADNLNGTTGATATQFQGQIWLIFPEKVSGSYTVIAIRQNNVTTVVNSSPVSFQFETGQIAFASNRGGVDQSSVFMLPVSGGYLADTSVANVNEITIDIKATDAEGNTLSRTVTLPVQ